MTLSQEEPDTVFDCNSSSLLDIYTLKGNAHGMPCVFPFLFKHQWHHECIREGHKERLLWCATTSRYAEEEKWGFCPDPSKNKCVSICRE